MATLGASEFAKWANSENVTAENFVSRLSSTNFSPTNKEALVFLRNALENPTQVQGLTQKGLDNLQKISKELAEPAQTSVIGGVFEKVVLKKELKKINKDIDKIKQQQQLIKSANIEIKNNTESLLISFADMKVINSAIDSGDIKKLAEAINKGLKNSLPDDKVRADRLSSMPNVQALLKAAQQK